MKKTEQPYQIAFYEALFGEIEGNIKLDRSTDGYTDGIIFEHKQNVKAFGRSKALSQALLYLVRFNADGHPVPGKIMLVSQDEQKVYLYNANDYKEIINDIPTYGVLRASNGIDDFKEKKPPVEITYKLNGAGLQKLLNEIQKEPTFVKVDINIHNVYGWSNYYYKYATPVKKGSKITLKDKFFEELANPVGILADYINAWTGEKQDFELIMDLLNDPATQKELGAFYTPEQYCLLSKKLLENAIKRVPEGNDYVIIDRCSGTGNLLNVLDDEQLSHVIVNTYELNEWFVLKDRIGSRVRYIIPPIPANKDELPPTNEHGFLSGANALSKDFYEKLKEVIEETKDKEAKGVSVILLENVPYSESQSRELQASGGKKHASWKSDWVLQEMKKEVSGSVTNDIGNAFIWSAFKYLLKNEGDSYIVFSPCKYWKAQALIDRKYLGGYIVNRKHFHAKMNATIWIAHWGVETDTTQNIQSIPAYNIDKNGDLEDSGTVDMCRIFSLYSEKYYDKSEKDSDTNDGIICGNNGLEGTYDAQVRIKPKYNTDIIGYMVANSSGFDSPDLVSKLTIAGNYAGNGFYLRQNNFIDKLPMFASTRYVKYNREWTEKARVMKSADGSQRFFEDIKNGKAKQLLMKSLIFTCFEPQNHCRSMVGSDGRTYLNQLCFNKGTLAYIKITEAIENEDYILSKAEIELFNDWKLLMERIKSKDITGAYKYPYDSSNKQGYNPNWYYGLYQIDEEINFQIQEGVKRDGTPKMVYNDGDLNNMLKSFKKKVGEYYNNEVVPLLFEYEFLK